MTQIKFCGLTRPEDVRAANALGADYIGFVFAPRSRRHLTPERAMELRRLFAPGIRAVGVFVDETAGWAAGLLADGVIDIAQLHGRENEVFLRRLRARTGAPVWQAFQVRSVEDIHRAAASGADLVLLDAGRGCGETFDWSLIRGLERPYLLAGGLGPENVGEAVRRLRPFGVDVSSGIETDGTKDYHKMAAFVAAVREASRL